MIDTLTFVGLDARPSPGHPALAGPHKLLTSPKLLCPGPSRGPSGSWTPSRGSIRLPAPDWVRPAAPPGQATPIPSRPGRARDQARETLARIRLGEYSARPGKYTSFGLTWVDIYMSELGAQHFGTTRPQPNLGPHGINYMLY